MAKKALSELDICTKIVTPAVAAAGWDIHRQVVVTTTVQFNLSAGKIRSIPVALLPPSEQRRTVAKVTELLDLGDQLKTRIAATRAKHAQLTEALVSQAVAA